MAHKKTVKNTFPPSEISWAAINFERESDPFIYRFFVYFLSLLLIAAGFFASFAKVPITVVGDGKLTSLQPPVPIRSSAKMTVSLLNVTENQKIKKGHVILQSKENLSREDITLLNRILVDFGNILVNNLVLCSSCANQLRASSAHYMKLKAEGELMSVVTPLTEATKELILALEENSQIPKLVQDSKLQISINKKKISEIKSKGAESILAKEVEALTTEIATHQTRINEKVERVRERISSAKIQMNAKMADLKNRTKYLGEQYTVYAPFNGTVVSLNVKGAGELLQTGQELMSLVPEDSPLIVELIIENKDLTNIAKDSTAKVTLDALSEFDYGYATGKVIEITRKQVDSSLSNVNERHIASIDAPVFIARISLDQQSLSKGGTASPFIIGMKAKGHIDVRTETLLHTIIRTLFQTRYEMQGSGK